MRNERNARFFRLFLTANERCTCLTEFASILNERIINEIVITEQVKISNINWFIKLW